MLGILQPHVLIKKGILCLGYVLSMFLNVGDFQPHVLIKKGILSLGYVLSMFLNFGHFQPHVLIKRVHPHPRVCS